MEIIICAYSSILEFYISYRKESVIIVFPYYEYYCNNNNNIKYKLQWKSKYIVYIRCNNYKLRKFSTFNYYPTLGAILYLYNTNI